MSVEEENPFKSVHDTICFSSRDYSLDHRDAWLYGVIVGWDEASIIELQAKHNWSADTVDRLKRLHSKYQAQMKD